MTQFRTLHGSPLNVEESAIESLRTALGGGLHDPGDAAYDEACDIWNAMVERKPALVARCRSNTDVAAAVDFAAKHKVLLSVRGRGHHIAGNSLADGGLAIDLSHLRKVTLDEKTGVVTAQPGASLGDLDAATAPKGWVVPTGINSTTGVAGLTLGGGFGWLSRKFGMTVDSLIEAEVVTADGKTVTASDSKNSDLFWALRGGGGNFGVVTRFTYQAHRIAPELYSGLIVHPASAADDVLRFYREFSAKASDELTIWVVMRKAPPLPFLPEDVHGKEVVVFALLHCGDPATAEREVKPLLEYGKPVGSHLGVQPFAAWQQAFDPLLTPGARNYWKSHNFASLSDDLFDVFTKALGTLPSDFSEIFIFQLGGATGRVPVDATAFPHRDTRYGMNVHTRWETAAEDASCVAWARKLFADAEPYSTGGAYSNFLTDDADDAVAAAYGSNAKRLAEIKAKYDPNNLFRMNHNVKPKK
ncbi:MAG TPA: FAD-binding oxidoreductase [Candidatus Krumholzibacteria bacterium]|nr:FAD-binding oxidoreductase [Candidatus Krumholzibacteria bacterium]